MKNQSEKIEVDLASKKRNRVIIISLCLISFIGHFAPFLLLGNFSPSADQLSYMTGRYIAGTIFYLIGYRIGRGKLQPTFEENKKKFLRGIIGAIICVVIAFLVFINSSLRTSN